MSNIGCASMMSPRRTAIRFDAGRARNTVGQIPIGTLWVTTRRLRSGAPAPISAPAESRHRPRWSTGAHDGGSSEIGGIAGADSGRR